MQVFCLVALSPVPKIHGRKEKGAGKRLKCLKVVISKDDDDNDDNDDDEMTR